MRFSDNPDFDNLINKYREPLTRAAYHLCGNSEVALDIVQDTLIDAYKGFDGIRDKAKAGAWLYAILRRKAFAYRKIRDTEVDMSNESILSTQDEADSIVREIYIDQMKRLPDEDREILAGKYLLGLSYKELAESLGIKEGALRVRCLRAKERLRELLAQTQGRQEKCHS